MLCLSAGDCMAQVLNLLLDTELTGADVELCIGKRQVRVTDLGQKTYRLECWHNPQGDFSSMVAGLTRLVLKESGGDAPGSWARILVQAAVIFAAVGALVKQGSAGPGREVDISAVAGDLSGVMSAWYARKWGLPIGTIVCGCNENNGFWELLHHGQLRTDGVAVRTCAPEADVIVPSGLERLIFACGGQECVERFLSCTRAGRTYMPESALLDELRRGMYAGVVSEPRMNSTISGVWRNRGITLSSYDAIAYASLQDWRAQGGAGKPCLILSGKRPGICKADDPQNATER